MANNKPTASQRDRTLSGQWTKSEKRAAASRSISLARQRTHQILKAFAQNLRMQ
jgi:hypothetical protein